MSDDDETGNGGDAGEPPPEHPLERWPEDRPDPTFSVLFEGRLVAYVWKKSGGGKLRRSGRMGQEICDVPFAEIESFDPGHEMRLKEIIEASDRIPKFRFKLGLEGYELKKGDEQPTMFIRRF